jgi:hypothetical protein
MKSAKVLVMPKPKAAPNVQTDDEPFMIRERTSAELADYDEGYACGESGGQNDTTKSLAWQYGWAESQE